MKKSIIILAAIAAAFVSCQKDDNIANEPVKGIPMTLKAGFDGLKTTVAPDGSVLKTTWDADESISVITLDNIQGNVLAVNTFTSTGSAGRTSAEFTGSFTGGDSPARVIVIYPALELSGSEYKTPEYTGASGSYSFLFSAQIDNQYFNGSSNYALCQTADNDCSHFENYCIMTGEVDTDDIKNGELTTSLSNLMTVIKVVATFPDAYKGTAISVLSITSKTSIGDLKLIFGGNSWEYVDLAAVGITGSGSQKKSTKSLYCSFNVPDTGIATFYLPEPVIDDCAAGDKWTISCNVNSTDLPAVNKEFSKDTSFDAGKMYTVNVDYTE